MSTPGTTITLQFVLGVATALVLHEAFPGRSIVRGLVLFPYTTPTVVAVILWKWLLNNQFGLVSYRLVELGLVDQLISWMGRGYVMLSLIFSSVWQFSRFVVLAWPPYLFPKHFTFENIRRLFVLTLAFSVPGAYGSAPGSTLATRLQPARATRLTAGRAGAPSDHVEAIGRRLTSADGGRSDRSAASEGTGTCRGQKRHSRAPVPPRMAPLAQAPSERRP